MHLLKTKKRFFLALFFLGGVLLAVLIRPSHDRNWAADQRVLPSVEFEGDQVHIKNIRNFTYRTKDDYDPAYYDKTFDLSKIETVWYIVEPFSDWEGAAHTFLSFGFEDDEYIAVSVEIRKEEGEKFSSWKGLLRRYELMYVIGDERDLIKLRSNYRHDEVFVYPVKATKEKVHELFVDMLTRVNEIHEKPEFYNTALNTCTTNIVSHINAIMPDRIPFDFRILFPGYSDAFAHELGLIDTSLPFEQARAYFKINDRAEEFADDPDFSVKIREFGTTE